MKVLHFLDSLGRGGAEMQALDVCRNARDFGIEITFVTSKSGILEKDFRRSGVDFVRLKRGLPVDLQLVRGLRSIIKRRKIEIVQGYQAVEGAHLFLAALGLPVKKVLSFQGFVADRKNRLALRFLIPRMDANIFVSRGLQQWLAERDHLDTSLNAHIIYNGADVKRLAPTGKSLRGELKIAADALIVGMVGNFYRDPRKDQMTLCRSLPKIFARRKDAHCVFAGKTETGALHKFDDCVSFCREHEILDRVHFLGARTDVPDILAALDVFVFSSLQEGLPVAVSEAMLARVPMIVTDIAPLLEASNNGEFAEVFPVGSAEILSDKIIRLLENEDLRNDLAARAANFARENFSIEAHLKNLKKLYQEMISGGEKDEK